MSGPLKGLRILEVAANVSAPYATRILADQGADVIKIESPEGDITRSTRPMHKGTSALFVVVNRNKRSVVLDLKKDRDYDEFVELVKTADGLITNFRASAIKRLRISYSELAAINPKLVYLSIFGYGADGPLAHHGVYDPIMQAFTGLAYIQRDPKTEVPRLVRTFMCDKLTGEKAAQAMTSALLARALGNAGGQHVCLTMLDAVLEFLWPDGMANFTFLEGEDSARFDWASTFVLEKAQDGYFAISFGDNKQFEALIRTIGLPDLIQDPRFKSYESRLNNWGELRNILRACYLTHNAQTLASALANNGVPAAAVNSLEEMLAQPQITHNRTITYSEHKVAGKLRQARHAPEFRATPSTGDRYPAPLLGEHTENILAELKAPR